MTSVLPPSVHLPSSDDLEHIAHAHQLSAAQTQALERCLAIVVTEIQAAAVAEHLGVTTKTVRTWIRSGRLGRER